MAGNRKSDRIEPSFDGPRRRDDGELRIGADDRIVASADMTAKKRKAAPRKPARAARRAPRRKSGSRLFGFLKSATYWCLVLGLWGGMGIGALVLYYGARMPSATSWAVP